MTRNQLIVAQNNDPEIQQWKTKEKPSFQGKLLKYCVAGGFLAINQLRCVIRWCYPGHYGPTYLNLPTTNRWQDILVVREPCSESGFRKRFWWPGVAEDIRKYMQSCPKCQKVAKRNAKATLIPMPVIGQPFNI